MWTCPKCNRTFVRNGQSHSCRTVSFDEHFKDKKLARELFDFLFEKINKQVGSCRIVSLPCCVHLVGKYDFLAVLPKKESLEIRFAIRRPLMDGRVTQSISVNATDYKNCLNITKIEDMDETLIGWITEAYSMKQ